MSNDQKCFLEVLGALLSVLTIWVATGILVYMAIQRCINQNFVVRPTEMIVVASFGVVFNIVSVSKWSFFSLFFYLFFQNVFCFTR
jgi:Co/Zn/Cd efflux system component